MEKFTKSILNYFATYTETRFRFQTKISYKWTDDLLTAEMSVFPEFQKKVLDSVKNKGLLNISIRQGEYSVSLNEDDFKNALVQKLDKNYSLDFLKSCIDQAKVHLSKTESDKVIVSGDDIDKRNGAEIVKNKEFEEKALREGLRKFNLAFRNAIQETLLNLQKSKREELLRELQFTSAPLTSLNPNIIEQEIYNKLQENAHKANDAKAFHDKIKDIIKNSSFDLKMYDLYATVRKFATFIGMGKPYIFFHEIFPTVDNQNETNETLDKYPIFIIELKIEEKADEIVLSSDRNVLLINTPAINSFGFNNILTIPRAARLNEANEYLWGVEKFLQNNYNFFNPFLLEYAFKPLSSENRPIINYRIGLQVVQKEDRRLFDYSELITRIDAGKGGKLIDFVKDYVSGNVKNTTDDVDSAYIKKYPKKSVNNLLSSIPLSLNRSQRRILTALENLNNKIVVVDGPPGTGKSYTIAAITYWANQQNKSVVITSHKKAALDVLDGMLIDKFRALHPKSKPSVLRVSENETGINTSQNTLSSPVITAANNRVNDFNESAVKKDIDNWRNAVDAELKSYWNNSGKYKEIIEKVFKLEKIEKELKEGNVWKEDVLIPKIDKDKKINIDSIKECIKTIYKSQIDRLSSEQLMLLHEKRSLLPDLFEACNFVNKSTVSLSDLNQIKQNSINILENFAELLSEISGYLKSNSLVFVEVGSLKFKLPIKLSMLLRKKEKIDNVKLVLSNFGDLQYGSIISNITYLTSKQREELTLKDLENGIQKNIEIERRRQKIELLVAVQKSLGLQDKDVKQLFSFLSNARDIVKHVNQETIDSIKNAEEYFYPLLDAVGLKLDNLKESSSFLVKDPADKVFDYIQLFSDLAVNELCDLPDANLISSYYESVHKQLENINDKRLKNLNNYTGDVERILVSLKSRKRLKEQELKVLLENISCIISEPDLISQYFPMEEDIIDIL
ncbi:MAG: AAA family ATPase, partial [Candidatus Omnitrophica bacterium]|nr:AAA family ATPase [Candidatus Omnitrophota bacterium]